LTLPFEPLEVDPTEAPPWLETSDRLRVRPHGWRAPGPDDRVVAWVGNDERRRPAMVRGADGLRPCFDVEATLLDLVGERYRPAPLPVTRFSPLPYHLAPARMRLWVKRILTRLEPADGYPTFPLDKSAETLRWLWARGNPTAPWPDGKRYAWCLTHDVDTAAGVSCVERIAALEEARGLRSAWYCVAQAGTLPDRLGDRLRAVGHEIGLHGDVHDNRLPYEHPLRMAERLVACRPFMERNSVVGFRSPSLCRSRQLFRVLGELFEYDSTVPHADEGLGCGAAFPFLIGDDLVELPLTVPMDASLLYRDKSPAEILAAWKRQLAWIRAVGGLAMITTHAEPHLGGRADLMAVYQALIAEIDSDTEAWHALPREVARWWKNHSNLSEN